MPPRRILSLWFPRLAAERVLRAEPQSRRRVRSRSSPTSAARSSLASLSPAAEAAGLRRGMALGDARAICPGLVDPARGRAARRAVPRRAPALGRALQPLGRRRTGRRRCCSTSPAARISSAARRRSPPRSRRRRPTSASRCGSASPTRPAPPGRWRATPAPAPAAPHAGDAIDQEARATRSRAQKRRWERGGAPPSRRRDRATACRIVPPGETAGRLGPLPVAALRLAPGEVADAAGLGLAPHRRRRGAAARAPHAAGRPRRRPPARPGARPRPRAGVAGAAATRSSRCA